MSAFLKTKSITAGQGGDVADYVLSQGKNETVQLIEGHFDALELEDAIALQDGKKSGLVHAIYTSDVDLTPEQLQHMRQAMREEYGIPQDAPSMLVKHEKVGRDGVLRNHYHEVISGRDERGRVIDTFRSKKRDELVSRMCEVDFGMELVPGRHNDFVYKAAVERGLDTKYQEAFQPIAHLKERARYSSIEDKIATRQQFDIHHWTSGLENVSRMPEADQPKAFAALVDQFEGAEFKQGDRGRSRLLVSFGDDGENLRNANKILKIKAAKVADFVSTAQEHFDELRRRNDGLSRTTGTDSVRAGDDFRTGPEPGAVHGPDRSRTSSDLVRPDVHDKSDESRHDTDHRDGDAERVQRRSVDAVDQRDDRNIDEIRAEDRRDVIESAVLVRPESDRDYRHGRDRGVRDALEQSPKRVVERANEDVYRRIQRQHHHAKYDDFTDQLRAHNASKAVEPSTSDGVYHAIQRQHHRSDYDDLTDQLRAHSAYRAEETSVSNESAYQKIQRRHHRAEYDDFTDRLRAHNASKTAEPRELKVTIQHRLARSWVAQKVQPLLDKLRAHNVARRGRSALDIRRRENISENLRDQIEALKLQNSNNKKIEESIPNDTTITRRTNTESTLSRAEKVDSRDTGIAGSGRAEVRREANEGVAGRPDFGAGGRPRAVVKDSSSAKSIHSISRAIGDRVTGRQMGRAAKALEPMRKSFAQNDGMYNTASDLQVMPDIDDPLYAEKVLAAWSRSMQGPGGP